ncbi:acyl carrier protein [Micromonospora sp. FIMYZ51]|uniref:acyl carrier protein n=1 Tax=Micromonospora sp. FIMYZ51 TaxID=3051832 RepID=UPI00311E97F8
MSEASDTLLDGQTEDQIRAAVRAIVMELAPEPDEDAPGDATLVESLGYHSLALMELAFTLEDQYDLDPLDEQRARAITTLDDITNHVITELRTRD